MEASDTLNKIQYNLVNKGSRTLISFGTRTILKNAWKGLTNKDAPLNPATPGVVWREAILWGAVTRLMVGVIRVVARKATADYWRENMGAKPEDW